MFGDSIAGPGGISAVVSTYRDVGFFRERNIRYLSSYEGSGFFRQIGVILQESFSFLHMRFMRNVVLVHIHTASRGSFWRATLFSKLADITGVPYILHIHSGEFLVFFNDCCGRFAKYIIRRTFRSAAGIICLTPGWKEALQNISPQSNFTSLPNPVSVPHVMPISVLTPAPRLLFLGRLTEEKGLFDLLQSMTHVLSHFPHVQLIIAGDGDIDAAQQYANKLGIGHVVIFEGWINSARKIRCLKEATIFVLPSHFEAFGVSIIEAMAYGKPVVATRVGGVPEVFIDGLHGRLIPPRDPEALANALVELLADQTLMIDMGAAGYCHARENYAADLVTTKLGLYYDSLLNSAGKSEIYWEEKV